ncbi:putative RNA-directed DNA polymerase from transposon BS [Stylophora pistillata]|uniref:Putative RNA-directed DNA polymerase from transposon BS n=1 Tax=Stylophora pistillata TaxID=50429 RepID=A0A2B4RBD6_STYPI|nr:putative RNA-directed DNA polymerase from transposon BS [Stylophora pistillata]
MWWSECRRLCGKSKTSTSVANQLLASKPATSINLKILANEINTALLEPQASFDPLLDNIETVSTEGFKNPIISLEATFKCLSTVISSKAGGPDNIPNWVLRDFAPELAQPLRCIINSSISQGTLPDIWKCANITPLPKTKIVEDAAKDLRPISLTPTLSKIAEHYVVHEHVKPALLKRLEPDQFGCIPGSSTAHALINLMHNWAQATDGTGNTVRIFALDYRKAFDLIDHSLLLSKLSTYNINPYIINWIIAFLKDRKQRVKLAHDCLSEWGSVRAGVPQGTKLGPWLFLVMINDLKVPSASDCIKYVDDTTVYEIISKGGPSNAQSMINEVATWSTLNSFQLHPKKCNELRVSFVRSPPSYDLIEINGSKRSASDGRAENPKGSERRPLLKIL